MSNPQNFRGEDPQTPCLMCPPPPQCSLRVHQSPPRSRLSGRAEIRTSPEQTNKQQTLHHQIIYYTYLKQFFFCAPNFPSRRLAAYFPLPRRRRSLSNPHNTTAQLSNLARCSLCPCGFRQSNTQVCGARTRAECVCV